MFTMHRTCLFAILLLCGTTAAQPTVARFAVYELALQASGQYANPYTDLSAEAVLTLPNSEKRSAPLFWDNGRTWRLRVSPDWIGTWQWQVKSADAGLNGRSGRFQVIESKRQGSIQPMQGFSRHFQRQNGDPFWFLGDTAWALYTDTGQEGHNRDSAHHYIDTRAAQGFNALHSMLLSEAGDGNNGGPPWNSLATEQLNPVYWQEVDRRVAYANSRGIVCGLTLAWGDKQKKEPYAWRRFPSLAARKRYARYIAARYSAYDVYFIVSGEWHAEVRTRPSTEQAVKAEFLDIGNCLRAADAHQRMIAIHPMTRHGSVREFNAAQWMSFADYQQNYQRLHERILDSLTLNKPVVNSEYGYFLRDRDGDGTPDKDNSTSLEAMRHATWDIVMAGAYVVTGFGATYFGGHRDPGPFDVDATQNDPWERQIGHVKQLFTGLEWWQLAPQDELLRCSTPRSKDSRETRRIRPPRTTYWCLAQAAQQYVIYVRGLRRPVTLSLKDATTALRARQFSPRSGEFIDLPASVLQSDYVYLPPDAGDWILVLDNRLSVKLSGFPSL
jgi:hypothetical protein